MSCNPLFSLRRLLRNQAGIAAVEFALIAPLMLLTYLGATDLTQAIAIDRKLGQVASTVSDLVAQEAAPISQQKAQSYFNAGLAIMRPFDFDSTELRVVVVPVNAAGAPGNVTHATSSNWTGGAVAGLEDDVYNLAAGRYAVIATARYDYTPMFATVFNATMTLEQRSVHMVRRDLDTFSIIP
ncbi:TadE/TadG family type IV pilus assembly protein [Pelagibacterium lacus]|nr:TadE/TadG family type IV pilus assembly protein [Pelagibacterium lacus]